MPNEEITNFIKQSKSSGQTDDEVKPAGFSDGQQKTNTGQDIPASHPTQIPEAPQPQNYSDILYGKKPVAAAEITEQKTASNKKLIIVVVIILLLLAGGAGAYFYKDKLSTLPIIKDFVGQKQTTDTESLPSVNNEQQQGGAVVLPTAEENKTVTPSTPQPASSISTACDNYDCLISVASKCQPISTVVSYSGMPLFLNSEILIAGKTQYEIKKSTGVNDCILIFSSPESVATISDKGRQTALAQGMTDAQITTQLQTINNSLKSVISTQTQTTCPGNASAISSYLTDAKNGGILAGGRSGKIESNGQATTYTTSSGQKLVCTIALPPNQPANIAVTISEADCTAQKGFMAEVSEDGTACDQDHIDKGTIVGGIKIGDKYPQCCVSK